MKQIGKLPPQSIELEEAVLGAIMLEKNAIFDVVGILKPDSFYKDAHKKIYAAILQLFNTSSPIDILTVTAKLRQLGNLEMIGGPFYITELTNRVASAANIQYHASIISQKFIQRELIRISTETVNKAYDETEDVFNIKLNLETQILNIDNSYSGGSFVKASDMFSERLKFYEKPAIDGLTGIGTGIKELNKSLGGWQNSDLIIIAARPGMGKTAFAINLICEAALNENRAVGFFSLEMSKEQLMDRMICNQAQVSMKDMKYKVLISDDFHRIQKEGSRTEYQNIIFDDNPGCSISQLRSKAIKMKQSDNIELLVVDYLGLMEPEGNRKNSNRTNEIGEVTRGLKRIAKELNIPVIALSQLSRKVEDRPGDKEPLLNDLRDSGDIEQDADVVLFLYRPEYYKISEYKLKDTKDKCYFLVRKHRTGVHDAVPSLIDFDRMKFYDEHDPSFKNDYPF